MKSKDISSRAKLGYGHICLREENFSFDKQLQDLETVHFNNKYI
jgi:hypothetical protein